MALQQEIAFAKAESMVGRTLTVMIEGRIADEDAYVARTYRDAPEVDGYLFLSSDAALMSGDFVKVKVDQQLIRKRVHKLTKVGYQIILSCNFAIQ